MGVLIALSVLRIEPNESTKSTGWVHYTLPAVDEALLSNMSNRRGKTIIDIYNRLNKLSQAVSRIEGKIQ